MIKMIIREKKKKMKIILKKNKRKKIILKIIKIKNNIFIKLLRNNIKIMFSKLFKCCKYLLFYIL